MWLRKDNQASSLTRERINLMRTKENQEASEKKGQQKRTQQLWVSS